MPTYEYRCQSCGRTFDYFQSMTDPRLETCIYDDCSGSVKRLPGTGAGIIFKGTGFYGTDYRSEAYKKAQKSAEKGTADTSKSGDNSKQTDSKTGDSKVSKDSAPAKSADSGSREAKASSSVKASE